MVFDALYDKVGIKLIKHFIKTPIINSSTFSFPDNSVLFWLKISDGLQKVSRSYPYLKSTKKATVITPIKYSSNILGSFTNSDIDLGETYDTLIKEEKRFDFLPLGTVNVNNNNLIIFNYGILNYIYTYTRDPLIRQHKFYNVMNRMFEDLKGINTMNRFILIDVPRKLPSMEELNLFSSRLTVGNLNKLPDYNYLTLIELWKWLTPEYKSQSVFNKIANNKLEYTTLILNIDNKLVLVSMKLLYDAVKEYEDNKYNVNTESVDLDILKMLGYDINLEAWNIKLSKTYDSSLIRTLFYICLYNLIRGKPINPGKDVVIKDVTDTELAKYLTQAKKDKIISTATIIQDYVISDSDNNIVDLDLDTDINSMDMDLSRLEAMEASLNSNLDKTYETLDDVLKHRYKDDINLKTLKELKYLLDNKLISKATYDRYVDALNKQETLVNPYQYTGREDNRSIEDLLDYNLDDLTITDSDTIISGNEMIFDDAVNRDVLGAMERKYLREQYHKDIVRAIYGLRNANNIILSYNVTEEFDIMGGVEVHTIEILNISGKKAKLVLELPYIYPDGTIKLSNNVYKLRLQRTEICIRKISATMVSLNTYYGKLFVSKARYGSDSVGKWFAKNLVKLADIRNNITNINFSGISLPDVNLPLLYAQMAREIRGFIYNGTEFTFNYPNRFDIVDSYSKEEVIKLENNNSVLVGANKKTLYFMDYSNNLYEYKNSKLYDLGYFLDYIGIDSGSMPIEYATVKLLKEDIPAVYLLSYYLGLDTLLKVLKVKYTTTPSNKRINLEKDQYAFKFEDETLIINKDNGLGDIILGGFNYDLGLIRNISIDAFKKRHLFNTVLNKLFEGMKSNVRYFNEINLLETMYIDPLTINQLRALKEPENFPGLLIRACELLTTDNYNHPNNLNEMVIKGYERIAGLVYKELVTAIKDYENKSAFTKAGIFIDRYAVMKMVNEDSTKVTIDDLNPIAMLKQREDLSLLGTGGRNKDTLVKSTRELHKSEIGIVSEATKDSSSVGVTAYMTAVPNVDSMTGLIKDNKDAKLEWQNILSTPSMLAPFGITDDVRRLNFSNIHASHVVKMDKMQAPYVLTGYETIIPIKIGGKFVTIAEADGEVTKVDNSTIEVQYVNGTKKSYKLYSWTSKEESGSCYTHTIIANLSKGDKFLKDDTLAYDKFFFEPSVFNPRRVLYKQGRMINVMLSEDPQTYEDSIAISEELHADLATTLTKVKSIVVDKSEIITNLVNIGQEVEPNTSLLTMTSGDAAAFGNLDAKTMSILNDIKASSPKAKLKGKVSKIVVYYNFDKETASDTLKDIINYSDKILVNLYGYPGKVTSGYSIKGKPLDIDKCEIKIYIDISEKMGTGDKCIVSNQLKCTVGEVFDYNMTTEDGRKIDAVFSDNAIYARIVNSPNLIGTTSTLMHKIEQDVIKMYFGTN